MAYNSEEKRRFVATLSARLSHAYIIEGAQGVGKLDFALFCASALLCSGDKPPCGHCPSCKKISYGSHPDIKLYGGEDGKPITMAALRSLIDSSSLKPTEGDRRIFIITQAHKMRGDTQNALLKLFEEPPAGAVIFLTAEKKESLLPTIISRGRLVTLCGEPEDVIAAELKKKHPAATSSEIALAVRASFGSMGAAEKQLGKAWREQREAALKLISPHSARGKTAFLAEITSLKLTREGLNAVIETAERMVADILTFKYGGRLPGTLTDEEAADLSGVISARAALKTAQALRSFYVAVERNGNITAACAAYAAKI